MKVLYPNICYIRDRAIYCCTKHALKDKMHMQSQRETTMKRMLNTPSL